MPKARTEPWVHTWTKNKSSVGAALSVRAFGLFSCGSWLCIRWESAAPVGGSINVCQCLTQGFRPGLCRSAALSGLTLPFFFVCPQGFILGFALISPWSIREYHPCRAYIAFCFVCPQGFILGFALISPWAMQEYRPYRASLRLPIYFIILMRLPC